MITRDNAEILRCISQEPNIGHILGPNGSCTTFRNINREKTRENQPTSRPAAPIKKTSNFVIIPRIRQQRLDESQNQPDIAAPGVPQTLIQSPNTSHPRPHPWYLLDDPPHPLRHPALTSAFYTPLQLVHHTQVQDRPRDSSIRLPDQVIKNRPYRKWSHHRHPMHTSSISYSPK